VSQKDLNEIPDYINRGLSKQPDFTKIYENLLRVPEPSKAYLYWHLG
jgi:hypothetical protein